MTGAPQSVPGPGTRAARSPPQARANVLTSIREEKQCNAPNRRFAPTMSAGCCAPPRPAALHEARAKRARGEIGAAELKAIEDREIERVIKRQEEVGLQSITDGEFRRSWWHLDFLWG